MPYANPEDLRARNRRYYIANREKYIAKAAAWKKANPERAVELQRAWVAANREKYAARMRAHYVANRESRLEQSQLAYERRLRENPEAVRAMNRERSARRRARERDAFVEAVDPLAVWERDAGICGICGDPADRADWHLDHIVAIARGGPHSYANVQVAHPLCNRRKSAS